MPLLLQTSPLLKASRLSTVAWVPTVADVPAVANIYDFPCTMSSQCSLYLCCNRPPFCCFTSMSLLLSTLSMPVLFLCYAVGSLHVLSALTCVPDVASVPALCLLLYCCWLPSAVGVHDVPFVPATTVNSALVGVPKIQSLGSNSPDWQHSNKHKFILRKTTTTRKTLKV